MTRTLHIAKLCVGAESPADLARWQSQRFGGDLPVHVTRMWPRRQDEVLDGGSIYWVFKGLMQARQRIVGLEEQRGPDGILRCALRLDAHLVRVTPVPRRPFQGWRYLAAADAPPDLPEGRADEPALPAAIAAALAQMGLR